MSILLGNLGLESVIKVEYLSEIKSFLEDNGFAREEIVSKITEKPGNFHIYDMPRIIVFGSESKMLEFYKFLQANNLTKIAFNGRVGISFESGK